MNLQALDKFHKTRRGYLVFGLIELALGCMFASLALGSGNAWEWLIAVVSLFGFLQNIVLMLAVHKK